MNHKEKKTESKKEEKKKTETKGPEAFLHRVKFFIPIFLIFLQFS